MHLLIYAGVPHLYNFYFTGF